MKQSDGIGYLTFINDKDIVDKLEQHSFNVLIKGQRFIQLKDAVKADFSIVNKYQPFNFF